jgi:hypothetical protein
MFNSWSGRLVAALLGAFLFVPAALAQTKPAPAAATGPWAKVPPLSTGCFQYVATNSPDPFYAKLEAAKAAISADSDRQAAINSKIGADYQNIDPMEMATRMQQWMMANPEEAMAFMQAAQAAPAESQEAVQADAQGGNAQDAEWNAVKKRYEDALRQAYAPSTARWKTVLSKLGMASPQTDSVAPNVGWGAGDGPPDWAVTEAHAIRRAQDEAYKTTCAQWWSATGPIHTYLKNYRAWLIKERIPYLEKFDAPKLQTYAIMSTPAASYRSTATLQGVGQYLDKVWVVFQEREAAPRCQQPRDCGGT